MVANLITTDNWMVDEQLTVAGMVDEIQVCFEELDPVRKYMFIRWLQAHSSRVKTAVSISEGLTVWLEGMHYDNLRWEFRIIMDEIDWWCNLDEHSLTKIMLADLARNGAK